MESIGEINCDSKLQKIKKSIQKSDFETISIGVSPKEMCRLSNGYFISSNFGSATIFDENFNQLKKVNIPGSAYGCAVHDEKGIYITDFHKSCIYLMDHQLNMIKTFDTKCSSMNQLEYPSSICFQDEHFYVSDQKNNRIQILTSDLKYHDTIRLNFEPSSIAVSRATIGVSDEFNNGIYFYDTKTKELKKKYPNFKGRISVIDSNFYVFSFSCLAPNILYVFDNDGELIDETSLEKLKDYISSSRRWDGFMLSTEDFLIILSYSDKKVLKFKL